MWPKSYRDYKTDQSLIKNQVSPSNGIVGCEMHDLNGWGNTLHHHTTKRRRGILATLILGFLSLWNKGN